MTQKKIRILLAEDNCAETIETLNALFPDATGGLDLTVVFTMATLIPTVKTVDPELSLSDPLDAVHLVRLAQHRASRSSFWQVPQRSSTWRRVETVDERCVVRAPDVPLR